MRVFIVATLAVYVILFCFFVWRSAVLEPFADMIPWVDRYYQLVADGDIGAYLLTPHNEHRIVWTLLVLDLDVRAFGASSWLFIVVGLGALGATAVILAREVAATAPGNLSLPATAFTVMVVLMGANALDVAIHINTNYLHALFFAVAAILLSEPSGPRDLSSRRLAASLACACAASLGNSVGLAVWPALVFGTGRRKAWKAMAITCAVGCVFTLVFLFGPPAILPGQASDHPSDIATSVLVFLNFLGLPFVRAIPELGWLFGSAILSSAMLGLLVPHPTGKERSVAIPQQLLLFSLVAALSAAVGRAHQGAPQDIPIRYSVLMIPAHVGLIQLLAIVLAPIQLRRPRLVEFGGVAAMAVLMAQQLVMGDFAIRTSSILRSAVAAYKAGSRDPQIVALVYPDPAFAVALDARMRRDGIYQSEVDF